MTNTLAYCGGMTMTKNKLYDIDIEMEMSMKYGAIDIFRRVHLHVAISICVLTAFKLALANENALDFNAKASDKPHKCDAKTRTEIGRVNKPQTCLS